VSMTIEELSKSQLVLLTILVNFVTSVATGILTVSMLDQAPPVVTQTINRVVDHTVERVIEVAPTQIVKPASPAPSTQDLVMNAIAAHASRVVAIHGGRSGTSTPALAVGTYLPAARAVVTTARESLPREVQIVFANGTVAPASLSHSGQGLVVYGFSDAATLPAATPAMLVPAESLRLGQTVLSIATDGSAATGIVSRVDGAVVFTTLPTIGAGAAAVDLAGNVIGISGVSTEAGALASAGTITALLTSAPK
jgi:hypothetical protein